MGLTFNRDKCFGVLVIIFILMMGTALWDTYCLGDNEFLGATVITSLAQFPVSQSIVTVGRIHCKQCYTK